MPKEWIPYSKREEWKDVQPVPQDDGPNPVVPIAYTDRFRETMDYFRAIVQMDERSERALQLCKDACELNPANYTAWYYKRLVLDSLKADLKAELEELDRIIEDNQKNYQVWYHRKALMEKYRHPDNELEFTNRMLQEDSKNYHCWSYRQWLVSEFKLWDGELEFTEELFKSDFRNNSAWNHRFYVLQNTTDMGEEVRIKEIGFAFKYIFRTPNNESAWNYVRGLCTTAGATENVWAELESKASECLKRQPLAHFAMAALILCHEHKGSADLLASAIKYCDELAQLDGIRLKYWNYKKALLEKRIASSLDNNNTTTTTNSNQ